MLDADALQDLVQWLTNHGLIHSLAVLVAECTACRHRDHLATWGYGPRNKDLTDQVTALQDGALAFLMALKGISGELKGRLFRSLYRRDSSTEGQEAPILRISHQSPRSHAATTLLDSEGALQDLLDATRDILNSIPQDGGGQASGAWDPTGRKAKERLVVEARWLLNELGIKAGATKDGPLADFIAMVHTAATRETSRWAGAYAERARKLEEEMDFPTFE